MTPEQRQELDEMAEDNPYLRFAADEIDRLAGIVEKLPVTRDGVRVVPFTTLLAKYRRKIIEMTYWPSMTEVAFDWNEYGPDVVIPVNQCYSTREAAASAAKEQENG